MSVNHNGGKLTVSRRKAKILTVNRKCLHPIEIPQLREVNFGILTTDRLIEGDRLILYRFNKTGSTVFLVSVLHKHGSSWYLYTKITSMKCRKFTNENCCTLPVCTSIHINLLLTQHFTPFLERALLSVF